MSRKYFLSTEDCTKKNIFPGVDIYTAAGDKMMLSLVKFEPGAVVELHQHEHEQCGILISGELTFTVGEETRVLKPGEMWCIPGNIAHTCFAGADGVTALDIFTPIREDYR
ncbi:MAG: cupin [Planctomycetaceae bacterium]|nr:cupin [Planctomycetaceae bacterium]|tara:strand:- start:235 stop:567 length:333 start_codon:yes stop_codon:yes gene_type:complete